MGGLAEHNLGSAFDALSNRDPQLAERVILSDKEIDRLQADIESQVIQMIALRAPLAEDLRRIMAALKITGDLERIGDLAKNIAKRSRTIVARAVPEATDGRPAQHGRPCAHAAQGRARRLRRP